MKGELARLAPVFLQNVQAATVIQYEFIFISSLIRREVSKYFRFCQVLSVQYWAFDQAFYKSIKQK